MKKLRSAYQIAIQSNYKQSQTFLIKNALIGTIWKSVSEKKENVPHLDKEFVDFFNI